MNNSLKIRFLSDSVAEISETPKSNTSGPKLLNDFIQRHDQDAFAELVRVYGPLVYGVCRRVVGNHHDAEEAFQATFLILSQKAASIRRRDVLPSWLYRVAYQVSLRARTALHKRRLKETSMTAAQEPMAVDVSAWRELEPILDQELSRLAEKYRIPILLCDLGGSTLKEAAAELGWSLGTLSTRLTKARMLLAQRLTRHGFTLSAGALAVLLSQQAASAAVPAALMATTLQTAGVLSASQTASIGVASSKVVALAQGTMKSMIFVNVKIAAAAVVVLGAAGLGVQLQREEPPAAAKAAVAAVQPTDKVQLPPEVRQALEENAAQLKPISISFTEQNQSRLPEKETYERLKISNSRHAPLMFQELTARVVLQDRKYYTSSKGLKSTYSGYDGYQQSVRLHECSFDGDILYQGDLPERPDQGFLLKSRSPAVGNYFDSSYFAGFTGLSFPEFGKERETNFQLESTILGVLRRGGKFLSVANVALDGQPHVKVDLLVENGQKKWADQADLEQLEKAYSGGLYAPKEREQLLQNVIDSRKLPATRRSVFYLDPELHYAVKQTEEWYDPDTLLLRAKCSDFEQLPGRQVWLPRRYEVAYHTYHTAPGVIFSDAFLSNVVQVTELNGENPSDEQFVLNYIQPGVTIQDETLSSSSGKSPRSVQYSVGRTPEETQRNQETAARQTPGGPISTATTAQTAGYWFLLANGVVLLSLGGFLAYRRFMK